MKQEILFLVLSLFTFSFFGCDKEEGNWEIVPDIVKNAFWDKYPAAKNVEWEQKGIYRVAEFINDNLETSAWFDTEGEWYMTETDISFHLLPQAVQATFQLSEYNTWNIEDIDMLERKGYETIYIIEVESKDQEIDLHYTIEGILIKSEVDNTNNTNKVPNPLPA